MEIYLLRHGIAEAHAASDAERDLTHEGREKVRETMKLAARAGVKPALVLSSPLRRAVATARIAADVLGYKGDLLRTGALVPDADPRAAWEEIRAHRNEESLLLAGHEPLFSTLGAFLLGVPELRIDFKKGALLALEMEAFGAHPHGMLKWMATPKLAG
jgi:phosphohistidine phosphatase